MTINEYCKKYRLSRGATLREVEKNDHIKTLSAFENNKSSNIAHLVKYITLAQGENDLENFMTGLMELHNG